jgi:hypothetical protein
MKSCNWFQTFCIKKNVSLYAHKCWLGEFDEKQNQMKFLKTKVDRGGAGGGEEDNKC